ncbi:putative HC-toxin efflux carrier TOXA [Glarea lozoyensis 74030]|uniref:Putative HC-toxin efflux carrier TOXA n=1 Tax=Glarea lozoyensis (strain ATCC 74030 / MF5533) TaxID=1104152 RepID=H0EZN4_GLAL7|nr:putative HC-toxin efflux carrier TOXA [Glarea lozoyensis 74030]
MVLGEVNYGTRTLFLGIFLFGLDVNIIGVAIPKITSEFGSLDKVAWYGSAYLLTVTAFQPGFGNLYRFFNAKLIYLLSIVIFEAPASNILIFGRALLGVGAAGLLQGALAIISYSVPLEKVPVYQGVVTGAIGISVSVGPVIGGALTQYAGWIWGGHTYPWQDSRIIGLFVGSGLLAILFCYWLWMQGEMALIPLRILRKRSIAMGAVTLFAINITLNIYGYYLPLFFQAAQGVGVTESGIRQMALVLPEIVAVGLTGFVVTKWGYYIKLTHRSDCRFLFSAFWICIFDTCSRVVEVGASALAEISPSPEVLAALRQSKVAEQRVVEHEMQRNSSSTKPDESRGDLSANEKDEKKTMV